MSEYPVSLESGLISIIALTIITLIGIKALSKYFTYKNKNLLYIGLSLILIWSPWWPSSISFVLYLFTTSGLSYLLYIFIGNFLLPFSVLFWLFFILDVFKVEEKKRKLSLFLYSAYIVIFEIFIIYWVFNPDQLGGLRNALVPNYGLQLYSLILISVALMIITGLLLSLDMLKAKQPELRLKGYFLLVAFILMLVGIMLEIFTFGNVWLLLSRIIIVIAVILVYIGFLLPEKIKKALIKS